MRIGWSPDLWTTAGVPGSSPVMFAAGPVKATGFEGRTQ
jgi:hypothetical protein